MTPTAAAAIAAKHGLSLADAAALQRMCDTEDEAEQVALAFASPATDDPALAPSGTAAEFAAYFAEAINAPAAADVRAAIAADQENHRDV